MGKLRVHNIEAQSGTNVDLGAAGDVVTFASDSIQTNLYKDSGANTIFQSDGAGTLSNVNSGLSGAGPKLIQSQTASGSASISFTTGIDSTYDQYMFVFTDINPATDDSRLLFQCSIDSGSNYNVTMTTTTFRAYHKENDTAAALEYDTGMDQAQGTAYQKISGTCGNGSDECVAGILYLFTPSSTTYVKNFYCTTNTYKQDDVSDVNYVAGYFNTTSAINAISFKQDSGNLDGTIKMYGCT